MITRGSLKNDKTNGTHICNNFVNIYCKFFSILKKIFLVNYCAIYLSIQLGECRIENENYEYFIY